ncbi:MAG TPA: redoxin domain-containing protein, partial [Acidilobales archaeon]|nr:redoxin domain-containing protein [Acidilobales archaeon]
MYEEFSRRGVFLLGLSVGSIESQLAWIRSIKEKFNIEIPFPIVADYDMSISTMFNMYHPKEYELGAIRATILVDDKGIIRFISYYPNEIGRSIKEILRVIDALKYAKEHKVLIPAEWKPGDKVLAHTPSSSKEVEERLRSEKYECIDWYFCYVK